MRTGEGVGQVHRFGPVVIDPVRAFADPAGVIGPIHLAAQFSLIVESVERLASFADRVYDAGADQADLCGRGRSSTPDGLRGRLEGDQCHQE